MKRKFSKSERAALVVAEGGRCRICSVDLDSDWHADHVVPYSAGGATDVVNGQALCASCNLHKGSKIMSKYHWQSRFLEVCDQDDFLLVAQPGSGKTRAALSAVRKWWTPGSRLIVVVPTDHLKRQWKRAAKENFQMELLSDFENGTGRLPRDADGVAVTYAAVAANPDLWRLLAGERRAFVVFDEIHHCGHDEDGNLTWGPAISAAFSVANRRLSLSGTPFRSDEARIPFTQYKDNVCVSDFNYSYQESVKDGICREVDWTCVSGLAEWSSFGKHYKAQLSDPLPKGECGRRLSTILVEDYDWLPSFLNEAHRTLLKVRETTPNAGGLVLAKDIRSAERLAKLLSGISGHPTTLVTSNEPLASQRIDAFSRDNSYWVVAVAMISEGVDIPRLQVLAYATNKVAELFFNQAVGRVLRGSGIAKVVMPEDDRFIALKNNFGQGRMHTMTPHQLVEQPVSCSPSERGPTSFCPIDAQPFNQRSEPEQTDLVKFILAQMPDVDKNQLLQILKAQDAYQNRDLVTPQEPVDPSGAEDHETLKKRLDVLSKQVVNINYRRSYGEGSKPDRIYFQRMNTQIQRGAKRADMTIDELKSSIDYCKQLLVEAT